MVDAPFERSEKEWRDPRGGVPTSVLQDAPEQCVAVIRIALLVVVVDDVAACACCEDLITARLRHAVDPDDPLGIIAVRAAHGVLLSSEARKR